MECIIDRERLISYLITQKNKPEYIHHSDAGYYSKFNKIVINFYKQGIYFYYNEELSFHVISDEINKYFHEFKINLSYKSNDKIFNNICITKDSIYFKYDDEIIEYRKYKIENNCIIIISNILGLNAINIK